MTTISRSDPSEEDTVSIATAPVVKQTRELVASADGEADRVTYGGRPRRVVKTSRTGVKGRMLVTFDNPIQSTTVDATDEWEIDA